MKKYLRWPMWVMLATLLVAALALTSPLFSANKSQTAHAAGGPTITPSQTVVRPGMKIQVTGQGFAANDQVALYFDNYSTGYNFATLSCDSNGNCAGMAKIPTPGVQGVHTLYGVGNQPNELASAQITLNPVVPPVKGGPGGTMTFYGSAFAANETVQVYWGTATGTSQGSFTTDSNGGLTFHVTAPTGIPIGNYPVTIVRSGQKPATIKTTYIIPPTRITLSKGGIRSGQQVDFTAAYFQSGETVTISWDANGGQTLATMTADNAGVLNNAIIPPSAPKGSYTITMVGATSGFKATHALNIGPGLVFEPYTGVNPGGTFTINGGGYASNETLQVYLQKPGNGSISVTTDASGGFSTTMTAPSQYSTSTTYYVYAVNAAGTEKAKVVVYFTPPSISVTDIYGGSDYIPPGAAAIVSGQGFLNGESVDVYWNYQQANQIKIATVSAASDGTFTVTVTVPSPPTPGYTNVAAIGSTSQLQAITQVVTGQ